MLYRLRHAVLPISIFLAAMTGCEDKSRSTKAEDDSEASKNDDDGGEDEKKTKKEKKGEATKGTVFEVTPPKVGAKLSVTHTKTMKMSMVISGKKIDMHKNDEVETKVEILAVSDKGVINKIKVAYAKFVRDEVAPKKKHKGPLPVEGKTYIVEKRGDDVVVTDENGGKVAAEEEVIVVKDHDDSVGKPDPFVSGMPKRALKKGERVTELELALQVYFLNMTLEKTKAKGKDAGSVTDVQVVFRGVDGDIGQFDLSLTMGINQPGAMALKMPLSGKLRMRQKASGPIDIDLKGPIEIAPAADAEGPFVDVEGDGANRMRSAYKYD